MNNEINETEGIDLGVLLADILGFARRLWWIAAVLAVMFSGFFCVRAHHSYYPLYRASATFTVYVTDPMQAEIRGYNTATAEQMAKTFPYILTSGALQDIVRQELDIPALPAVGAETLMNTNIFTLSVTSPQPQLCLDVLNSVIRHYPDVAEFVVGPTVMNLLDESGLPTEPCNRVSYSGQVKKGVLLGVGAWALLMVFLAMARSTVHNEDELKRLINIRCMGALPKVRRRKDGRMAACPMVGDTAGGFSEAVRLLRVRVEKEMQEKGMKVLLVSSATPGEGKTTVAINLAKAMAMKGRKTLLIDCDLRNPSIAGNLGMEERQGLADFIRGRIMPREALLETDTPNLYVTLAGGTEDGAAEMLACPESREFLAACRETFDVILLDTPPSSLLADAAEISDAADGALLVIRQNYASKALILDGAQMLSESGLPLIGCVMNYAAGRLTGSYGSYYGSGYGYGSSHYGKKSRESLEE